ncbi:MAG TPA: type II toxin-antitoxin system RelE/ParE family toxin [Cytophagaceae bacterium]|jgi:mRNA-degrading endonuclease RelE of RelBE toxin-antitoxin system|nr:type II toxin-antitoxin system RelE/ParE family toxin [Cytophagaceae bacterium]
MYNLFFNESASLELEEAIHWYDNKVKGLGEQFLKEIQRSLNSVEKNPELFAKKKRDYRVAHVRKFPFVLVYKIDTEKELVVVLSIFHTKRNPAKKFKKS